MRLSTVLRTIFALIFLVGNILCIIYLDELKDALFTKALTCFIGLTIYFGIRVLVLILMSNILHKNTVATEAFTWWMICTFCLPYIPLLGFEILNNTIKKNEVENEVNSYKERFSPRWKAIHTIVALILLGFILIVVGVFEYLTSDEKWNILTITLGATVLLSGVSSIILQVFSSISFFQREMVKTFYDILSSEDKYLGTIDYRQLRKNWKILSKYLYKKRFSEISDDLSDIISDKYFPRDHPVYYEGHRTNTNIKVLDIENEYIQLDETINVNIVANSEHEQVFYTFSSCIPLLSKEDQTTSVEIKSFEINGENYLDNDNLKEVKLRGGASVSFGKYSIVEKKEEKEEKKNKKQKKDEKEVVQNVSDENALTGNETIGYYIKTNNISGLKRYQVKIVLKKVYSLKSNQLKSFNAVRIVDGCKLTVQYPDEMILEFKSMGTVKKFQSVNENTQNILSEEYEGLLLPSQGFVIGMRLKSNTLHN